MSETYLTVRSLKRVLSFVMKSLCNLNIFKPSTESGEVEDTAQRTINILATRVL